MNGVNSQSADALAGAAVHAMSTNEDVTSNLRSDMSLLVLVSAGEWTRCSPAEQLCAGDNSAVARCKRCALIADWTRFCIDGTNRVRQFNLTRVSPAPH